MSLLLMHTADAAYYHGIQRASSQYDRFFYELIAPESTITVDADDGRRCLTEDLRPTNEQINGVTTGRLLISLKSSCRCNDVTLLHCWFLN
jgi:hypothetical protein